MARVESEAGIIATLIHHPEFSYYSEQLLPNHFTNEENRYIYQAICSLARDGITTIDPYNITGKLADSAKIARNASTIAMISDKTPEEIEADGAECGNKKLRVTVNRNGMQMTQDEYIDLLFDGNHILYEQAKQHIPQTPF